MPDRAALTLLSEWLRCPICFSPLSSTAPLTLGCDDGHRFDVNKRGFVNLLTPRTRVSGDTGAMLADRAAFLDAGHYSPIVDSAARLLRLHASSAESIADLGCGTGYYLDQLSTSVGAVRVLAADLSPDAVRMAVRSIPHASGVVCDIWQPLPLRDASADVLLNIFAPRNIAEFARVVRTAGMLLCVVPSARHLRELSAVGAALEVPAGKRENLRRQLTADGLFEALDSDRVEFRLELDDETRELIVGMGPSAHHRRRSIDHQAPSAVTVSVDVLAARRSGA